MVTRSTADRPDIVPVLDALDARGAEVFCLDSDCFPSEIDLSLEYEAGHRRAVVSAGEAELDLAAITAVWLHKFRPADSLPGRLSRQIREIAVQSSIDVVSSLVQGLDVFCLDRPQRVLAADNKPWQLQVAAEVGLTIPRTLVTSSPAAVRRFALACGGRIITKMISFRQIWIRGAEHWVFTNPVSAADLADLDGLRLCPMIFQEEIEKRLEIRVSIVGERVFVGAADSGLCEQSRYDRRRDPRIVHTFTHHALPPDVERALLELATRLGLNYGAADLLLTPDGRYVFLEINPMGGFTGLEKRLGLPVSAAIADLLTGRASARV